MLIKGELEFDSELLAHVVAEVADGKVKTPKSATTGVMADRVDEYAKEVLGIEPLDLDDKTILVALFLEGLVVGYHYRAEETFLRLVGRNQRTT